MRNPLALPACVALSAAVMMTVLQAGQAPATAEPKPTTYTLIDRALEAKRIDEETAHKYRMFAAFGDERLPREYLGAFEQGDRAMEIDRAGARLETFSQATRAELAPYFMRPDQPGSWVELSRADEPVPVVGGRRGGLLLASHAFVRQAPQPRAPITWRKFPAVGGKVMVWAQDRHAGDTAKAEAIARAMDGDRIWARLTGLIRREPASDAKITPNGGDGAFDVYLVHPPLVLDPDTGRRQPPWLGIAKSALPGNTCQPIRYLMLDSRAPLVGNRQTQGLLSTTAHELFHAITYTYQVVEGCDFRWTREGTATWAENWIYPAPDTEHQEARTYLERSARSIDDLKDLHPDYGTYLLPLYLEKISGGPDFMRAMWEAFMKMNAPPLPVNALLSQQVARHGIDRLNTLKGVGAVLDGGWDRSWPKFLLKLWNQAPTDAPQGYRAWDRLTHTPFPFGARQSIATPAGPVTREVVLPTGLIEGSNAPAILPLAGVFSHFTFEPDVRSVVFVNTIADVAHEHKSVWGIQKIRGQWVDPEDWTKDFQKAWCRSEAKEDLEELVIVFGNSDSVRLTPVKPEKLPEIKAYPVGCTAWTGTSDAEKTIVSRDPAIKIVERVTSRMRLEVDPALELPGQPREYWKITGGQLTWSATVTGACTGGGSGQVAITDRGPGEEVATLRVWEDDKILRYSGSTGPWP